MSQSSSISASAKFVCRYSQTCPDAPQSQGLAGRLISMAYHVEFAPDGQKDWLKIIIKEDKKIIYSESYCYRKSELGTPQLQIESYRRFCFGDEELLPGVLFLVNKHLASI